MENECECYSYSFIVKSVQSVLHFFLPSHICLLSGILLKFLRFRLSPTADDALFSFVPGPFLSHIGQRTMSSHVCSLQGLKTVWESIVSSSNNTDTNTHEDHLFYGKFNSAEHL